jgi:hypothetical protein
MGCEATLSDDVVKVACPEPFSVAVPRLVAPSMKVTVPVRVPLPGATGLTVAVKVTDWPETDGLADELTDVDVSALFTVWVRVADVLT